MKSNQTWNVPERTRYSVRCLYLHLVARGTGSVHRFSSSTEIRIISSQDSEVDKNNLGWYVRRMYHIFLIRNAAFSIRLVKKLKETVNNVT